MKGKTKLRDLSNDELGERARVRTIMRERTLGLRRG